MIKKKYFRFVEYLMILVLMIDAGVIIYYYLEIDRYYKLVLTDGIFNEMSTIGVIMSAISLVVILAYIHVVDQEMKELHQLRKEAEIKIEENKSYERFL